MRSKIIFVLLLAFLPAIITAQSWNETRVGECTFLIPDVLELQDPNGIRAKAQQQIKPYNKDEMRIYQTTGLDSKNNLESISASLNFARVILKYVKQDLYSESFISEYTPEELVILNDVSKHNLIEEYKKYFPANRIIWYGLERIYINGKACLVKKFERPGITENKNVYVEEYRFITQKDEVTFTFSTRAIDWKMREFFHKIVQSIRFD